MTDIVLIGSEGRAGLLHSRVHCANGHRLHRVDPKLGDSERALELALADSPGDKIVDICTPTDSHVDMMLRAHALGATKFVVEKPAAMSTGEWREARREVADADIFVVQNYLFSTVFAELRNMIRTRGLAIRQVRSRFDKDRRRDSANGRGADRNGVLPHVFRVELPHQLYLANALLGPLDVMAAAAQPMNLDGHTYADHGAGSIRLEGPSGTAELESNLARPPARWVVAECADRSKVTMSFGVGDHESTLRLQGPTGQGEVLIVQAEDNLQRTLGAAVTLFCAGHPVPAEASALSADVVMRQIDSALALASSERAPA